MNNNNDDIDAKFSAMDLGPQNLTDSQLAAIAELRSRLQDILEPKHDDYNLNKWLKARNYDVTKAEDMFRASMKYRKKMKADTLLTNYDPPEVLQKYLAGGFAGYDKDGSPILIELFGYIDYKGILASARERDIELTKLQLSERVVQSLNEQTKKLGRRVEGMTVILDMDKVGLWLLWGAGMQMIAHMGKVVQDNYPEVVKRTFIVNAPRIFPTLWKMIRPLITEDMKKKVILLGGNYKTELLEHVDAEELPGFLGGSMKDPDGDPRCPSRVCQGGKVPEKYYIKDLTADKKDLKMATVLRGTKYEYPVRVDKESSVIRWEFKTDGYDIAFGLLYQRYPDSKKEVVMENERVNSHHISEFGTHNCEQPGKYFIVFDNTYSWARGKTVYYKIDVLTPNDDSVIHELDEVTLGGKWEHIAKCSETTHL